MSTRQTSTAGADGTDSLLCAMTDRLCRYVARLTASLWRRHLLALFVFIAVYIGLTYPVMTRPGYWVWGRPFEDAFECIWYLEWYARALFDLHVSPLFHPGIFYPGGWDLRFAPMPPLYPLLLAPITAALGPVATYNLTLLFTCVFASYGAFVLALYVSGSWWGACVAGILFAFLPQRAVYLAGHLNFLLGSMWLPWIAYGMLRSLTAARHRARWALFAGLAVGLSIAGAWQFIFISAGLAFLFLVGACVAWRDQVRDALRDHRVVSSFALSAAVVALPLALMMLPARESAVAAPWSFPGADATSVHLERVLSPSWLNPLWRNFSSEWWPLENGQDGVVGFSVVATALVLVSLARRPLKKSAPWLFLVLGAIALMLGLTLHVGGQTVLIPVPERVAIRVADLWPVLTGAGYPESWAGRVPLLLPSGLLFLFFPPYRNFHHYGRWALVAVLGLAVLTAHAISSEFRGRTVCRRIGYGLLVLSAVLLEYNLQPPSHLTSVADMRRGVDSWLAARPEQGVIIEYPLWHTVSGQTLYYGLFHNQKMVHGYSSIPPKTFYEIRPTLDLWPSAIAVDLLDRLGVDYVLVNVFVGQESAFRDEQLPAILAHSQLRLVDRFPDAVGPVREIYLFELTR